MLDEIRGHDPHPKPDEQEWISTDPFAAIGRVILIAGVAIMIGVSGSLLLERYSTDVTTSRGVSTPAS